MHADRDWNKDDGNERPSGWRRFFMPGDNPLGWSVQFLRVAGVTVKAHILFLMYVVFTLLSAAMTQGGPSLPFVAMGLVCLFGSVLLHEFGHIFACRFVKGEADEILMWPLGGLAMCRPPHTWQANLITTLGGPLVNLLLMVPTGLAVVAMGGGLSALVFNPFDPVKGLVSFQLAITGGPDWVVYCKMTVWWLYYTNLVLLAFNMLLPMFPMDGGRVLQALVWAKRGYRTSMKVAAMTGLAMAMVVATLALTQERASMLLGIALFGGFTCWQELQRLKFAEAAGEEEPESPYAASLRRSRDEEAAEERRTREIKRQREDEERHQQELDRILAKISREGMGSLTRSEKKFLEQDTTRRRTAR